MNIRQHTSGGNILWHISTSSQLHSQFGIYIIKYVESVNIETAGTTRLQTQFVSYCVHYLTHGHLCLSHSSSAGVGRTGVFIALDHLIQHISDHDFVDVYGLVAELRSERMCMVQNLVRSPSSCAQGFRICMVLHWKKRC